jgi:hypothetical protein
MNINNLVAKIDGDLVRQSLYHVMIGNSEFNLFAHTISLPTRMIQTRQDNNYIVGRTLHQPYATDISGNLSISFYLPHNGEVKKTDNAIFFMNWLAGSDSTSIIDNPIGATQQQSARYLDEVARNDITIIQYDRSGNKILKWILYKAFPISVTYDQLGYASINSFQGMTVEFDIDDFIIEEAGGSSASASYGSSSISSPINGGSMGGGGGILSGLFGGGGGILNSLTTNITSGKLPAKKELTEWDLEYQGPQTDDKKGSFFDEVKSSYNSAKDTAAGFYNDITANIDPDILSAAKQLAVNGVRNAINGVPSTFTQDMKDVAGPTIGNMTARVSDDPNVKNQLRRQTSAIVQGMPERVTSDARQGAISDITNLINAVQR